MDYVKSRLLVAGPTCGKTVLCHKLNTKGFSVVDTDDIISEFIPDYFRLKLWNESGKLKDYISLTRDIIVADTIRTKQPKLVLSNLWSKPFMNRLFIPSKAKPGSIFVFRANPLTITAISKKRGTVLSAGLTSKWINSARRYAPEVFELTVWLPDDVFLTDVVEATPEGWRLTPLGRVLAAPSPDVALAHYNEFKEGGQNDEGH